MCETLFAQVTFVCSTRVSWLAMLIDFIDFDYRLENASIVHWYGSTVGCNAVLLTWIRFDIQFLRHFAVRCWSQPNAQMNSIECHGCVEYPHLYGEFWSTLDFGVIQSTALMPERDKLTTQNRDKITKMLYAATNQWMNEYELWFRLREPKPSTKLRLE